MAKTRKFRPIRCQKYLLHKNKWIKSCIYKKHMDKNTNKKIEKKFLIKKNHFYVFWHYLFKQLFFGVFASNFSVLDLDPMLKFLLRFIFFNFEDL